MLLCKFSVPWFVIYPRMQPTITELLNSFPAFCGTQRFITVFRRVSHWPLSRIWWIDSIPLQLISLGSILIVWFHLLPCLSSVSLPFPTKPSVQSALLPCMLHSMPITSSLSNHFNYTWQASNEAKNKSSWKLFVNMWYPWYNYEALSL
jgi:hypothetical protein